MPMDLEAFLTGKTEDKPTSPLPPPDARFETPPPTPVMPTTPRQSPPTPAPSTQHAIEKLPDLQLDWSARRPILADPVRYATADQEVPESTPTIIQPTDQTVPDTPATPTPSGPCIPLESIDTDAEVITFGSYPKAKPDGTVTIQGLGCGPAPEFPPRRVRVPSRRSLDPRLIFRDAPSSFLSGALAGLAARQRMDIVRQTSADDVQVEFGCQDGVICRTESVSLADGRMVTMKTSVNLQDNVKLARSTQTQTEGKLSLFHSD